MGKTQSKAVEKRHGRGTAGEQHGNGRGTAWERQGNGMGPAWERHGMCESAFKVTKTDYYYYYHYYYYCY
jgi:hypothetical protein